MMREFILKMYNVASDLSLCMNGQGCSTQIGYSRNKLNKEIERKYGSYQVLVGKLYYYKRPGGCEGSVAGIHLCCPSAETAIDNM